MPDERTSAATSAARAFRPLCVDLDGTLLQTDSMQERLAAFLRESPWAAWKLPLWLLRGRAGFKGSLSAQTVLNAAKLPVSAEFLEFLRAEHAAGRRLVLATGTDARTASQIAAHFGLFDEVLSSDARTNLTSHRKRRLLVERFGEKGFDYAGNSTADLAVWGSAHEVILVNASGGVRRRAGQTARVTRDFRPRASPWAGLVRALRPHQWLKNVLLLVPVITGHKLGDPRVLLKDGAGILAFCLCASSVYVVNDLHDLDSDREHPKKRFRPFASGQTSIAAGLLLAPALLAAGLLTGLFLPSSFQVYLVTYCAASTLYSGVLKKRVLVDVFALAGLYTLRLLAGHAATGIAYSSWLLGFSMFLFLSLALLKRYIELRRLTLTPGARMAGRGYEVGDLPAIFTLGITSGFISALVLALYINSEEVKKLYHHPMTLLAICPLLLYWVSRVWFLATRRQVDEDPVVFALRDKASYLIGGLCALLIWLATAV